jgi:glycosyltransferase 2 family protein
MGQDLATLPGQVRTEGDSAAAATAPVVGNRRPIWWGMLLGKMALLGVVLYFVGRAMAGQLAEIPWEKVEFRAGWLGLSLVTICAATFVSTISFSLLFVRSGNAPGLGAVCAATWLSSLGKYVPGKFAGCASATWLLNRSGVPAGVGASVWLLQQGITMLSGLLMAIPLCFWGPVRGRFPLAWVFVAGGAAVFVVILHPGVMGWGINQLLMRLKREPLCILPTMREYVLPVVCLLIGWALLGAATWMAAQSVQVTAASTIPIFAAAMALANVVGLLAVVPAGLGVREAVVLAALSPLTGPYTAVLALLMRGVATAAEAVMAGAGMVMYRQYQGTRSGMATDAARERAG